MSLDDDLLAEGEPEKEFIPGIAARMPRKRVAAGALIRDRGGRILFVVPNYKPGLDIPGGVANPDESPLAACRREVFEELGVEVPIGRLLLVDWVPRQGVWGDALMFVFDGGTLDEVPTPETGLLRDPEIKDVVFLDLIEAAGQLRASMSRRLMRALASLESSATNYSEFGRTHV